MLTPYITASMNCKAEFFSIKCLFSCFSDEPVQYIPIHTFKYKGIRGGRTWGLLFRTVYSGGTSLTLWQELERVLSTPAVGVLDGRCRVFPFNAGASSTSSPVWNQHRPTWTGSCRPGLGWRTHGDHTDARATGTTVRSPERHLFRCKNTTRCTQGRLRTVI